MLGDVDCDARPSVLATGVIRSGANELRATAAALCAPDDDTVEFVVEGERLVAQRSTLAQHCTFFSNMFR